MANLYRITINEYSDENFTNKILSWTDLYLGIPQCIQNPSIEETIIQESTSLDFFVPYLVRGSDITFLGSPYMYSPYDANKPERFMPFAREYVPVPEGSEYESPYIEIVFSNGANIRSTYPIGNSAFGHYCTLRNKNGTIITESCDIPWIFGGTVNLFPYCPGIVCDEIINGELTGNLYSLYMSAAYRPGGWKQLLGCQPLNTTDAENFKSFLNAYVETDAIYDPYNKAGDSAPGGGGGTWGDLSDSIDFPSLPTLSAVGTGFVTLYIPTATQLSNLANYMWNGDVQTLDFWRKIVADPIDLILGLNIIPVALPSAGGKNVTVGGVSTDVYMTYTSTQYVEIDCGSLTVPEFYGAYLDYAPYTKFDLYLPYCGTHPLIADEIVGKTIHIKYHVDALSGACIAYVKCGDSVLYEFSGNVCAQIPVTANQFGDMVRSAISIASAIGTMVATDGATAPMTIGAIASAGTNSMGLKPTVEKSGAIGGMAGQLGIQKPYLIITRPSLCVPRDQNAYMGYPSFVTVLLGDLDGYNEISSIHLENVPATDSELSEIENLLKGGVLF